MGNPSPDNPPFTLQTTQTLAQFAEVNDTETKPFDCAYIF
jgi:hypothetical protein